MIGIKIEYNEFDSGFYANRVGNIELNDNLRFNKDIEKKIIKKIHEEDYNFVSIRSSEPLTVNHFRHQGTLITFENDFKEIFSKVSKYSEKFKSIAIDNTNWESVKELCKYSHRTRFIADPNIPNELAIKSKFKLIQKYFYKHPTLTRVIPGSKKHILGLFCADYCKGELFFYQMIIHPKIFLRGFAGMNLVKSVMDEAKKINPYIRKIRTGVYDDNNSSLNFFKGLGFKEKARHFYYHYWVR